MDPESFEHQRLFIAVLVIMKCDTLIVSTESLHSQELEWLARPRGSRVAMWS
jgi:hypothetical protein